MKKGKGTATMTAEEISNSVGDIGKAAGLVFDQYPKGSTKTTRDPKHGVDIITDVRRDPYAKIRTTKPHPKSYNPGEGGNPIIETLAFDKKAYEESQED